MPSDRLAALLVFLICSKFCGIVHAGEPATLSPAKKALVGIVNERLESDWEAALKIWHFAEPGYQEQKSSQLLSKMLSDADFEIQEKVAGIPTAFILSLIHI